MNKFFELMIISSFFLLNACNSTTTIVESPFNHHSEETLTVLFSNSSTLQNESSYYDALLELKIAFNTSPPRLIIIDETEHDIIRYYNIEKFPTMLVLTGEKEHLRIEGAFPKDEILTHLLKVYQRKEEKVMLPVNVLSSHQKTTTFLAAS